MRATCVTIIVVLFLLVGSSAFCGWTILFSDEFSDSFDTAIWQAGSSAGGGVAPGDNYLEISSGTAFGGGTWLDSMEFYDTTALCGLNLRCYAQSPLVGDDDDSFWGFFRQEGEIHYYIAFRVFGDAGGTRFVAKVRNGALTSEYDLGGTVYGTSWQTNTDYRIEVLGQEATFYIDGTEVCSFSGNAVPHGPFHVRLDKTSPGENRILYVDYASLETDFVIPTKELSWGEVKSLYR